MTGAQGPLRGLKVVELAGIGPAPFAGMLLADLGADVVRVDRPGPGSPLAGDPRLDLLNRGKRSITADLKQDSGRELVLALASRAAVLIEGYRPGVTERLGIGPAQVLARNPALVYGRMTGWGQDGPLAGSAGHDITYLAITGALHAIGRADGPPQVPANLLGDFGGGALYLVVGLLAALREADRTGRGQVVDAAITDGVTHLTTLLYGLSAEGRWEDTRGVNLLDTGAPFYDVYPASDGGHLAVGALEPQFYAEFVRLLDPGDNLPAQYDRARWPELRTRLAATFATRTRDEWAVIFEGTEACVAPVLSFAEAARHPHLVHRATLADRDGVRQPAPAPRFSATPPGPVGAPALPGEHAASILADWEISP
ncbi:CaiB/BaiF CoA transferase family protein [Actinoplanes friuliensis]|uniref:L-carnitine dehydratase/bile acid-inducible protein F n=1 Tax=Actinoplanes friuliensis DSM 7358 TaxID=1246995 RepID=U5W774_9ACTN|nr:CaiB/BaiF CoA-transferase family protein [Actinoplanes friuliensis]AGZ43840.1 L-carnitine dehydratase/bile acid-inducible protein F [Actinoplanes friuliensis DSM 7358]